ncbi:hypothetical protein QY884_07985 [Latilactobacillus sakei]
MISQSKAGQKVEVTFDRTVNDDATIDTTTTEHDQTGKLTASFVNHTDCR